MKRVISIASALALCAAAHADFVTPDGFGWVRGSMNSTYGQYERFTSVTGPNVPDVGVFNPTANPFDVWDTSGGSILTSSGNIYSFSLPINVHISAPSYAVTGSSTTRVLLQVRTQGNEILASSVNIGGVVPRTVTELFRTAAPMGGFLVDTLYEWELTGNAASYEIRFDSADASLSLDRVCVDTFVSSSCYPNCDASTAAPVLNANDFQCFLNRFAAGESYANCDNSTAAPVLNANDFQCFLNGFAAGCV